MPYSARVKVEDVTLLDPANIDCADGGRSFGIAQIYEVRNDGTVGHGHRPVEIEYARVYGYPPAPGAAAFLLARYAGTPVSILSACSEMARQRVGENL